MRAFALPDARIAILHKLPKWIKRLGKCCSTALRQGKIYNVLYRTNMSHSSYKSHPS
jgi:hypothetical protein